MATLDEEKIKVIKSILSAFDISKDGATIDDFRKEYQACTGEILFTNDLDADEFISKISDVIVRNARFFSVSENRQHLLKFIRDQKEKWRRSHSTEDRMWLNPRVPPRYTAGSSRNARFTSGASSGKDVYPTRAILPLQTRDKSIPPRTRSPFWKHRDVYVHRPRTALTKLGDVYRSPSTSPSGDSSSSKNDSHNTKTQSTWEPITIPPHAHRSPSNNSRRDSPSRKQDPQHTKAQSSQKPSTDSSTSKSNVNGYCASNVTRDQSKVRGGNAKHFEDTNSRGASVDKSSQYIYNRYEVISDDFYVALILENQNCSVTENADMQWRFCSLGQTINEAIAKIEKTTENDNIRRGQKILINIGFTDICNGSAFDKVRSEYVNLVSVCKRMKMQPTVSTIFPRGLELHSIELLHKVHCFNKFLLTDFTHVVDLQKCMMIGMGNYLNVLFTDDNATVPYNLVISKQRKQIILRRPKEESSKSLPQHVK